MGGYKRICRRAAGVFVGQMVVTATRTEKKDLDIPAVVEVYSEEQIEKSSAANAYDVLQNTLGVNTQSQGFKVPV